MLTLIDFVTDSVRNIISLDADVISRLAASRKRCEAWLQIEVFKRFVRQSPDSEIVLERAYPSGDSRRCDLWCRELDLAESWVELKTCATNYQPQFGFTSTRPITNQIDDAINAVQMLAKLPTIYHRHLFLLAYPMPADGLPPRQLSDHLIRIENRGGKVVQVLTAPLCLGSRNASAVGYTIALSPT
jgi:hypothetical protein